jgi:hypothetical protein
LEAAKDKLPGVLNGLFIHEWPLLLENDHFFRQLLLTKVTVTQSREGC